MGDHIHAVAAAGGEAVRELAEELDEDSSWLGHQHQQQRQSAQVSSDEDAAGSGTDSRQQRREEEGQQEQDEQQHWSLPPEGVSRSVWARATPLILQVSSASMCTSMCLSLCLPVVSH